MSNYLLNDYIPDRIVAFPRERRTEWVTDIYTALSQRSYAIALNQSYPRYIYQLKLDVIRDHSGNTEYRDLEDFFNIHKYDVDTWLYQDPNDYLILDTARQLIGAFNPLGNQLYKVLSSRIVFLEPVFSINDATVKIYSGTLSSNVLIPASNYTIINGKIIWNTGFVPQGTLIFWSGIYYYRCRFIDKLLLRNILAKRHQATIQFVTVKP